MKTITLQGEFQKFENLNQATSDFDKDRLPYEVETRVYVVNQEDSEKAIKDLTDEEFIGIAEQWGRIYTLEGFQETFNNQKDEVSHSEDFIRFINVIKFD